MLTITAVTASVLALYFIRLALEVIALRRRHKVSLGDGGNEDIRRAMRAHGNFAEYVPIALLLMALAELNQAPRPLLVALGVALISGRVLHRSGIRHPERAFKNRVRGMQLTFAAIATAAIANIVIVLVRTLNG